MSLLTPAVLLSVLASGLWCFAMLWVDRRFLPKPYRMSVPLAFGLLIAGLVLTAFSIRSVYDFLIGQSS